MLAALCIAVQLYFSKTIIDSGFLDLERSKVSADVRRVQKGIVRMLQNLDRFLWDWASWDDTYEFVRNRNAEYAESNFIDETFVNSKLNAIILWNDKGELVYGRFVDPDGVDDPRLLQAIFDFITKSRLTPIPGDEGGEGGIILAGGTPLLLALRPVLLSDGQGTPEGKMLMARLLTPERIQELSQELELPITFYDKGASEDFQNVWQTLEGGRETVVVAEGDIVDGFGLIDDAIGRPCLLLHISKPRKIVAQGKYIAFQNNVFLAFVISIYSFFAFMLLKWGVLSRLERLTTQVRRIGSGTGEMSNVTAKGRDEISELGQNVNLMLGKIRETTAALEKANDELTTLVDTIPDPIWFKDPDGVFLNCNPAFAKLLGAGRTEVIGKTDYDFIPRDMADFFRETDRKVLETGQVAVNEESLVFVVNQDKSSHIAEVIKIPMRDASGNTLGVIGIARDITARKQAETQRDELERMFCHDLRSPLSGIYKVAALMREEGGFGPDQDGMLQALEYAGYKMLGLVGASLALQRMEEGTYALSRETFDLLSELERIINLFKLSRGRKDEIIVRVDGQTVWSKEAIVIRGDAILCFSMLNNLMDNAVEASPAGTRVWVDLERRDGGVSIAIHNQGAVPEEIRNRFFEKYATSGKAHGTGLGTYSARLITEAHGGVIDMRTSDEDGTTVTVWLPGLVEEAG